MKWPEPSGIYSTDVFNRPIQKISKPKVSKVKKVKVVKDKVVKVKVPKKVKVPRKVKTPKEVSGKKVQSPKKKSVAARIVTPSKDTQFTITQLYDESDVF